MIRAKIVLLMLVTAGVLYFTAAGFTQAYVGLMFLIGAMYVWAHGVIRRDRRMHDGTH